MTTLTMRAGAMADNVQTEAKQLDLAKAVLTALFLVPFVLGWLAGGAVTAATWLWAAVVVGFRTARRREAPKDAAP